MDIQKTYDAISKISSKHRISVEILRDKPELDSKCDYSWLNKIRGLQYSCEEGIYSRYS